MAHYWTDNIHTTALTPRDYQVELLAAASEKNLIVCLGHNSSKEFIAQKLIHEKAHQLRCQQSPKISLFLCRDGNSTYNLLFHLTDLRVCNLNAEDDIDWEVVLHANQVIILSPALCVSALICSYLELEKVNLIVIEDCHLKEFQTDLHELFSYFEDATSRPQILGLAGPLHSAGCKPGHLSAELEHLEETLHCQAESASDIVTVLRYCNPPVEIVLQCPPPTTNCEISCYLQDLIKTQLAFLQDHRFDPSEIYSGEFLEEIQSYSDPKAEPLDLLREYLQVLDELGAWCADRVALNLLMRIEKMKVKTPYERHFLLLCMISSCFVQARAYCEHIFGKLPNEKERIERYSTPKVKRLLEVLSLFNNAKSIEKSSSDKIKPILADLDGLNFKKCQSDLENIQKRLPTEDSTVTQVTEGLNRLLNPNRQSPFKQRQSRPPRTNFQPRPPRQRNNWHHQNDPDALCGLIFCNSKAIAKILYNLLYEMSRSHDDFKYLSVQFTVDRVADPITETKEAELEHRRQEEVLKRFRMHECNLLIGTAVLEEGIDLPKCNLVIRWDAPKTYRSYVQCKGKARAANAYHVIMVSPTDGNLGELSLEQGQHINAKSHRLVCPPDETYLAKYQTSVSNGKSPSQPDDINHLFQSDDLTEIIELPVERQNGDHVEEEAAQETEQDEAVWKGEPAKMFEQFKCQSEMNEECDLDSKQEEVERLKWSFREMENSTEGIVNRMAEYMEIEKVRV